jgi:hypothetical protein
MAKLQHLRRLTGNSEAPAQDRAAGQPLVVSQFVQLLAKKQYAARAIPDREARNPKPDPIQSGALTS